MVSDLQAAGINPAACRSLTNSITIISLNEVNPQLNVTGAINNTFCNGDNVVFTVPAPAGTNYEFKLKYFVEFVKGKSKRKT